MIHKLPFGLRDSLLVEINQVEAGLKCGCVCPSCGSNLVARKGKVKIHHFAHHNAPECKYAVESALHFAAKQILSEEKKIKIPGYKKLIDEEFINDVFGNQQVLIIEDGYFHTIFKERMIKIENVELEKRFHDFVPDVILQSNGQTLIVEIAVTHFIDDIKKEKIRRAGVSVIEIDLREYKGTLNFDVLRKILIRGTEHKRWIYNIKSDMLWNIEKQRLQMENNKAISDFHLNQSILAAAVKERNHKVAHELQSRKNFYKAYYKKILNRTIYRQSDYFGANQMVPIQVRHVEPCPKKKKVYQGKHYANFGTDCKRCNCYRGVRKIGHVEHMVCLAEYYISIGRDLNDDKDGDLMEKFNSLS